MAALVIERAGGEPFEAFLQSRFFGPLGMRASFGRPGRFADWSGVRTQGYRWRDGTWTVNDAFDLEAFLGASNLYFSAADLARWGNAHATGNALPAAVVAAGQRYFDLGGGRSGITGLSWYCDDAAIRCRYTGDLNGFYSFVYWNREQLTSAAFVSNSTIPPWQRAALQRALVAALESRPDPPHERAVRFAAACRAWGETTHFYALDELRRCYGLDDA